MSTSTSTTSRAGLALAVATPALACGAIGLTHPGILDASTAEHWRNMHLALIPIFPLIGLAPWLIARRAGVWLGRLGALFGFGFAAFYTSLDVLAGVAGGALVLAGHEDASDEVFALARVLGAIGVACLVLGGLTAGVAAFRVAGLRALPASAVAVIGAILVLEGHIYPGRGTVAMAFIAAGYAALALAVTRDGVLPHGATGVGPVSASYPA